jgi:immunity protein, SdpI family
MRKWYPAVLIAAAFLFSALVYRRLPSPMAVHWDVNGHPNGYGSRPFGAFFAPVMALVVWAVMRGLPSIDPRRDNYAKFQGTYDLVVDAVVTLMVAIHIAVIGAALGWPVRIDRLTPLVGGVMLIVLGNVLPRARSNWWFGIRTPWTLSSDTVWSRTHRVGGYLMTGAGVVTVIGGLLPPAWSLRVLIGAVAVASLGSVVYSYFAWRGEQP